MKKSLIIISLLFSGLFASAQFSVLSNVDMPNDGETWGVESVTNNIGIGYNLNDKFMIGGMKAADTYNVFARYNLKEDIYLSLESTNGSSADSLDMSMGVGYSYEIMKNLYIQPNYLMPLKEDENGERSGEFRFGILYKL